MISEKTQSQEDNIESQAENSEAKQKRKKSDHDLNEGNLKEIVVFSDEKRGGSQGGHGILLHRAGQSQRQTSGQPVTHLFRTDGQLPRERRVQKRAAPLRSLHRHGRCGLCLQENAHQLVRSLLSKPVGSQVLRLRLLPLD